MSPNKGVTFLPQMPEIQHITEEQESSLFQTRSTAGMFHLGFYTEKWFWGGGWYELLQCSCP